MQCPFIHRLYSKCSGEKKIVHKTKRKNYTDVMGNMVHKECIVHVRGAELTGVMIVFNLESLDLYMCSLQPVRILDQY